MNHIIAALTATSFVTIVGCNKSEKLTSDSTAQTIEEQMEVDVEVDGGELRVMINGEEQVVELDEIMEGINLEDIDGEMSIAVMAVTDDESTEPTHLMKWVTGEPSVEMYVMGEHGDPHENMHKHMMQMTGEHGDPHENMHKHMMKMMGEHGDPHENMHKHMMQMMGEHGDPHENMHKHMMQMMHGHGGEHGGWSPHHGEQEVPEVIQFMQELGMLGEVAAHLEEGQSVALLGIHMIRDNLEGDLQIDSLTAIVEEAASGSPARNAALIVAIQALQDAGDDEAAAELMVELVLSN